MKYKFGNDNLITGYIKNLLHEFNLPQAKVITSDDMPRYDGKFYIKDRKIFYGKNTKAVGTYAFNAKIPNFTKNYVINSSVYDSRTHAYLGDFLRFIRDYHKLDLMPLYNCFNNESPYGLKFTLDIPYWTNEYDSAGNITDVLEHTSYFRVDTSSSFYNYYIVPIKFDAVYNIAIDSNQAYEICAMIYTGSQRTKLSNKLMKQTYKLIGNSRFDRPFQFTVPGDDTPQPACNKLRFTDYEENLRLLIKLPKSVNTSIAIIEGQIPVGKMYADKIPPKIVYNEEEFIELENGKVVQPTYTDLMPSTNLSLLSLNDGQSYPFADRLVEYLLRNAINHTEKIQYNVARVQNKIYPTFGNFKGFYDVWNINLNYRLHDFMDTPLKSVAAKIGTYDVDSEGKSSEITSYKEYTDDGKLLVDLSKYTIGSTYKDLLGYVDKDIEYHLEAQ